MKIKIKNLYGFNCIKGVEKKFEFDDAIKTHLVYGTNASGKSSFSKSIDMISKESKYEKNLQEDDDTFVLELKYDDINISIDEKSNSSLSDSRERIFVYNKNYIGDNLSPNLEQQSIEIGTRITDLRKYSKENYNYKKSIYSDVQMKLKEKLKLSSLNGKTLAKDKKITKYVSANGKDKGNIEILRNVSKNIDEELYSKIKCNDLINDNISVFNDINGKIKEITDVAIGEIKRLFGDYNIDSTEDIDFYKYILSALKRKHFDKCPVCLSNPFNQDEIIQRISAMLDNIKGRNEFKTILEKVNSDSVKESYFGDKYNIIFNNILKGNLDPLVNEEVNRELKIFNDQYDSIILKYIGYDFDEIQYNEYVRKEDAIKQIIEENSNNNDDNFIDIFNELLSRLFGANNKFKAQKMVEDLNGEKLYSIQLITDHVPKKSVSIVEFFNKVLSESQKARLSLAYYFASIVSKGRNKKIICLFDDPLDSYDSNGKYIICREIRDFCEKHGFYENYTYESINIILTHSVDFLRIMQLFRVEWNYYILNSFEMSKINEDALYVFDGDPNILIKKLENNKKIDVNEMLPLTAILRSICSDITKVLCIDNNHKRNIVFDNGRESTQVIQKELSNKFIHGWFKNDKFKIVEYRDYLKTKCNIEVDGIDAKDLNKNVFDFMKEYIENNKNKQFDFVQGIFFKNYLSLYVRSFADGRLAHEIKNYCVKPNGTPYRDEDEVADNFAEITKKVRMLESNISSIQSNDDKDRVKKLIDFVCSNRVLLNDFAQSENAFISPINDVKIED